MAAEPSLDMQAEETLIQSVARGDRRSFAALFSLYAPKVKRQLVRMGAAPTLAEDITQEVMIRVWRTAERFDPARGSEAAWIFTIARNAFIDAVRRERHPDELSAMPSPTPQATPEQQLLAIDGLRHVSRGLERLPRAQGEVCAMVVFGEAPLREVSSELGLTLSNTKSNLRRGLAKLRATLVEAR